MKNLGTQVKDILNDGQAALKSLEGEGRKVADKVRVQGDKLARQVRAKVAEATVRGPQLVNELSVKDLIEHFGSLKPAELIEKLKSSELARHTEACRAEVLGLLRLPSAEHVDRLEATVEKLAKEVSALKGLKAEIKKLHDEIKAATKPAPRKGA
jgi:hypothetical protein